MKRQAALVSLGLIAGLGLGYALGVRRAPAASTIRVPETAAPAHAAAPVPATPTRAIDPSVGPRTADDAQHLLTAWVSGKNSGIDTGQLRECLHLWSENDPHAVLGFIDQHLHGNMRNYAFAFPLAVIGRRNPREAVDWLRSYPTAEDRDHIAKLTVDSLTKPAPSIALAITEGLSLNLSSLQHHFLLGALAADDPAAAQTAFSKLPAHRRKEVALAVGRGSAANNPQAALLWCKSLGDSPESGEAMQGVVSEIALKLGDEKALEAVNQLQPSQAALDDIAKTLNWRSPETALALLPQLSPKASAALAERFIDKDFAETPDEMLALARAYLPPEKASAALAAAWADWRDTQSEAADAWLASLADSEQRALFEPVKLRHLASADPVGYLDRIASVPFAATEHEMIEEALGEVSPAEAANWVAINPKLLAPEQSTQTIVSYYEESPAAATTWALRLPTGASQDQVLETIVLASLKEGDSANAGSLIAAISDPHRQTGTRFKVFTSLYRKDRAAATQWLAAQPVTPEIRANWETLATTITDNDISSIVQLD